MSHFLKPLLMLVILSYLGLYPTNSQGQITSKPDPRLNPPKIINSLGIHLTLINNGSFVMGATAQHEGDTIYEKPAHTVTIKKSFYISETEITQEQWYILMGYNPSVNIGKDNPVENVSYDDIQEFIRLLNLREGRQDYRLPTEAEWEYSARAGSTTNYFFGNDAS
ncbi:MAG: formylglycine-generating enzyme family protein, partial [Deltaproteobacteria bacterium]|nr:formylglycine-generating enzyme family protein [Deltaproteobacteria bacterium]